MFVSSGRERGPGPVWNTWARWHQGQLVAAQTWIIQLEREIPNPFFCCVVAGSAWLCWAARSPRTKGGAGEASWMCSLCTVDTVCTAAPSFELCFMFLSWSLTPGARGETRRPRCHGDVRTAGGFVDTNTRSSTSALWSHYFAVRLYVSLDFILKLKTTHPMKMRSFLSSPPLLFGAAGNIWIEGMTGSLKHCTADRLTSLQLLVAALKPLKIHACLSVNL